MKITIERFSLEDINLSDDQVKDITKRHLRSIVAPGEYLRTVDSKLVVKQDDPYYRHGSISEVYVRDATELDIAVFTILRNLDEST